MISKLFMDQSMNNTLEGLQKAMNLTWKRNELISANIANAETPLYRAQDLHFGTELQRAFEKNSTVVSKTNSKHLDLVESENSHPINDLSGVTKPDGNNVDIDIQMGQLAFNSGRYSSAVRFMRKELALLRYAVREAAR